MWPQDSNGQLAQLCPHLWALHRLEILQLSAEGCTVGESQKLYHCKHNMLLSKFFPLSQALCYNLLLHIPSPYYHSMHFHKLFIPLHPTSKFSLLEQQQKYVTIMKPLCHLVPRLNSLCLIHQGLSSHSTHPWSMSKKL